MKKIREVLRLRLDRKASVREIVSACSIGPSTVDEYLHRAAAAGLSWPLPDEMTDSSLEQILFPPRPSEGEPARPMPDWPAVQRRLGYKGLTLLLLWQEYRHSFADGYRYSRYAGLYREWLARTDVRMLQHHKAGEKMFVDWSGLKIGIIDAKTGQVELRSVFVCCAFRSKVIRFPLESDQVAA